MNNNPIGIFDSGIGGLSVWRELRAALPGESLLYYGDGANCPYGERSAEEITALGMAALDALVGEGAKLIVVACNTATGVAIGALRARYAVPVVGMEPAVKPAVGTTRTGVVGILATRRSLEADLYRATAARWGDGVTLVQAVGEGFVELVERGAEDSAEALDRVRAVLEPMIERGADRIVIGCTHYSFLAPVMCEVIGGRDVQLVDSTAAVVRRVGQLLAEGGLEAGSGNVATYRFLSAAGEGYAAGLRERAGLYNG